MTTRTVAQSHVQPRTLEMYREYFSERNSYEDFIDLKVVPVSEFHADYRWEPFYCRLDNEGVFAYYTEKPKQFDASQAKGRIPLESIVRVKANGTVIVLYSASIVYYMQAREADSMNNWLLSIHKCFIGQLLDKRADDQYKVTGPLSSRKYKNSLDAFAEDPSSERLERATSSGNKGSRGWSQSIDVDPSGSLETSSSSDVHSDLEGFRFPVNWKTVDSIPSTPCATQGAASCGAPLSSKSAGEATRSNGLRRRSVSPTVRPMFDSSKRVIEQPFDLSPEEARSAALRVPLKYKAANGQTEPCAIDQKPAAATGRYVPPHMRDDDRPSESYVPPHLRPDRPEVVVDTRLSGFSGSMSDDDMFAMEAHTTLPDQNNFATCAKQGHRKSMEDYHCSIMDLQPTSLAEPEVSLSYHAVYDGHCGSKVAELASERLHVLACQHESMFRQWPEGVKTALESAFSQLEADFTDISNKSPNPLPDGSTALVLIVNNTEPRGIAVANIGDSRAVLCRANVAVDLSTVHTAGRPDEKARIEAAGGWVTTEREMLVERLHHMDLGDPLIKQRAQQRLKFVEVFRTNGELAVSRALGDLDYKLPAANNYPGWFFLPGHPGYIDPKAEDQTSNFKFKADLVLAKPEWVVETITEEDEFVILACDGLWDVLDSQEAIDIVLKSKRNCRLACEELVSTALRLGSSDNITVTVVYL